MARESKQRRAIRLAIERRGGEVIDMRWQPIGQMVEMQGREGGWTVFARMPGEEPEQTFEDHFVGYNWLDVLDHIELSSPLASTSPPQHHVPTKGGEGGRA